MPPSPEAPPREPKLLDRFRDALRARHMSYRTEKTYVHWIRRYLRVKDIDFAARQVTVRSGRYASPLGRVAGWCSPAR